MNHTFQIPLSETNLDCHKVFPKTATLRVVLICVALTSTSAMSRQGIFPWPKRARLNGIAHILKQIPYKVIDPPKITLPKRSKKHAYDDVAPMAKRTFVRENY